MMSPVRRIQEASSLPGSGSFADILGPCIGMGANEVLHESAALGAFGVYDLDAALGQQRFLAHERAVVADDDARNAVEQDRATAHGARRQRRVQRGLAIDARRLPPGVLQRVHLAVQYHAALLDST